MGVEDQVNSPGFRSCYLRDTEPDRCLSQLVHIILFARAAALSLTRNLIAMCVAYYNFAFFSFEGHHFKRTQQLAVI